jgi:hypothetical protein
MYVVGGGSRWDPIYQVRRHPFGGTKVGRVRATLVGLERHRFSSWHCPLLLPTSTANRPHACEAGLISSGSYRGKYPVKRGTSRASPVIELAGAQMMLPMEICCL